MMLEKVKELVKEVESFSIDSPDSLENFRL